MARLKKRKRFYLFDEETNSLNSCRLSALKRIDNLILIKNKKLILEKINNSKELIRMSINENQTRKKIKRIKFESKRATNDDKNLLIMRLILLAMFCLEFLTTIAICKSAPSTSPLTQGTKIVSFPAKPDIFLFSDHKVYENNNKLHEFHSLKFISQQQNNNNDNNDQPANNEKPFGKFIISN